MKNSEKRERSGSFIATGLEKLAHFKHPRAFHIVSALPRNAMGKVVAGDVRKQVDRLEKAR